MRSPYCATQLLRERDLHSAQSYFNLPWGQGVHTAQMCFSLL